jgi:uncharacterized Rmd1/YagE family protein
MPERVHQFCAVAFIENLALKEVAAAFPGARVTAYELHAPVGGGDAFVYGFGAVVFRNVDEAARAEQIARLRALVPGMKEQVVNEQFTVHESEGSAIAIVDGVLQIDRMTTPRAGVIALTAGQSAAMEYYEKIVDGLFGRTSDLVDRLEELGTVPMRTRPLHKFIGRAVGTRNEVLVVLHLLDKPDATWDDPAMDRIYADLRAEFDLSDRYESLASKLRSVQEGLELVLDVARDRRLTLLESMIVLLILVELALSLAQAL